MSTFDDPFDADRALGRSGCVCGQHRSAAEHEHATSLVDLMFRRVGAGWTSSMGRDVAERAAASVADILGWDEARARAEASEYRSYLKRMHALPDV